MTPRRPWRWFITTIVMLMCLPTGAAAGVLLKLGDILAMEPGAASVSVIDPVTGAKTVVAGGGLLSPEHKAVGVAFAPDGDLIVVHRTAGLIRVNPATGAQSIQSQGGHFRDPWAIAIDKNTGFIYVADSGYDNDRPAINEAGKIIRVHPASGAQEIIASGSPCTVFPTGVACQNTTSAGSYLSHPYGIAIDYTTSPTTLVVADMGSFNGKGAIIRLQPVVGGTQTLLWGPATASPAPQVAQSSPLGCPMGVAVEPNGNLLTTAFTFPVPSSPTVPPPAGTYYGCSPPGIFRVDLASNVQRVVNTNAPAWVPGHAYAVGAVIHDQGQNEVHRVVVAGTSQVGTPAWNGTLGGTTNDGSVVWQNIGHGANWLIPFGLAVEPAPTASNPSAYNIIVGDEGYRMVFRLDVGGDFISAPLAADVSNVTSVDVITYTPAGGFKPVPPPVDNPPVRSNGHPSGALPAGTTQTTMGLTTDENATCRYASQAGVAYASMTSTFTTTGSTAHSTLVNVSSGQSYQFYVRCIDAANHPNTDDFVITFSVPSSTSATATFDGAESPLSQGGMWDSPGSWLDLHVNHGAFATWLNGQARLVTPLVNPDQYSEITYDQDPGTASWVGVATRIQGPSNGSGYLAIAYAGQVRLYRTDDAGGLSFTLLASANAPIGTAPRRLRLESQGNTHRVVFNGTPMISHNATGTIYSSGQPGIAASVFGGPTVRILTFEGGSLGTGQGPVDSTPPFRSNGQPSGALASGTTQATMGLTTGENATCRYASQAGVAYASMTNTFSATGSTAHTTLVSGLTNGQSYQFYVRCIDAANNANPDDFVIAFSVSNATTVTATFTGAESPLSQGGIWDSPGSWADLHVNAGAYAVWLNAQARLVTPSVGANQYSEITYDQDPGTASWAGVATRIQGPGNGSGYLAIAYAGQVRLYRTDDTGSLNFILLASANAPIGTAPRRLRLESQGNTHRVFFNGTLMITHNATGTIYSAGQPGISASVFGGPTVKILSFEGGAL
jgi:hypothetical protein